jgi:hypothetical protein
MVVAKTPADTQEAGANLVAPIEVAFTYAIGNYTN